MCPVRYTTRKQKLEKMSNLSQITKLIAEEGKMKMKLQQFVQLIKSAKLPPLLEQPSFHSGQVQTAPGRHP